MTALLEHPPTPVTAPIRTPVRAPAPTADRRDLFIDALRVIGISVVVLEHWSMPVLSYDGGRITAGNALSAPGAWALTWLIQVMPLVFFAGGAANAISFRRGGRPAAAWPAVRLRRLAWPVLALAAVWIPLPHVLLSLGVPAQPVDLGARLVGQLLWFLAAYLVAVMLTPLMLRAHDRYGALVPVAFALAAGATDAVRFAGGVEWLGYPNVVFVWIAVHQFGVLYASGRLTRPALLAAGGFGAAALLVAYGPYPGSMIGMPGAPVSNMAPPTLALLAVAAGQVGLAVLLRPWIVRLPWGRVLDWAGPRIMSVYLWHMPALVLVTGVVVVGLGIDTPVPGSLGWLAGWPLWLAVLGAVLYLLLRCVARFERAPALPYGRPRWSGALVSAGLVAAGVLTLTVAGFATGFAPILAVVAIVGGLLRTAPTANP
ncbi:acyltransferase [Spongiactinospora sp. TRM90649]|uniref:acyltransferase family protein n=1 Tax=Spongiactinospora sp. TRM90649 TaxID=3031114 RepID=UPI0023F6C567|nr:acyltransferase [Spongiactinospora sp. TRM90649]MDF5752109.1 acyltransferase [Spongiactinospora sp. TRM90649]